MTVLVTGGAGYIGSHTVRALRDQGREVVVVDSLELGHPEALLGAPLIRADIADRDAIGAVLRDHEVDAVVHFAAYKAAGESMENPARYFENNVAGSLALLQSCRDADVGRFVFSSTCAVYGTPEQCPVTEDAPLHPESPYGESKLMVERMLAWFDRCHGLRSVSLRYFNAAGASSDGQIGEDWTVTLNLVPVVMKAALGRTGPVQVFGTDYPTEDGTAIRDYIHVEDLADAHVRALEYLERGGETTAINLGTGQGSSVREVLETTRRISRTDVPSVDVARRPGDPVQVFGDNTKAWELLGWAPKHGIEEIIETAYRWHSSHPDGYGR